MKERSTDIQVWFLRHGKTFFNYENSNYDDFIEMLCNGHSTPLVEDSGIDFKSLPKRVDLVCYSPFRRAFETAEVLRNQLRVNLIEERKFLHEVEFDRNIILRHEYTSLAENRKDILERWHDGRNKTETFDASLERVREIESFISKQQEQVKTIILVTHGWFLRLLEVYFLKGKRTGITPKDLLEVNPVELGHCFKATVARKDSVGSLIDLAESDILKNSKVAETGNPATETMGRGRKHYQRPAASLQTHL